MMTRIAIALLIAVAAVTAASAQRASTDWPQWRGANRDGAAGFAAPARWPDTLTKKWSAEVGIGYAAPITVGDRVYAFVRSRGNDVVLVALNFGDAPVTAAYRGLRVPGTFTDAFSRATLALPASGSLEIPAHGYRVLVR